MVKRSFIEKTYVVWRLPNYCNIPSQRNNQTKINTLRCDETKQSTRLKDSHSLRNSQVEPRWAQQNLPIYIRAVQMNIIAVVCLSDVMNSICFGNILCHSNTLFI